MSPILMASSLWSTVVRPCSVLFLASSLWCTAWMWEWLSMASSMASSFCAFLAWYFLSIVPVWVSLSVCSSMAPSVLFLA